MKYDREGFKSVSPRYNGVSGGKSMTSKALLTAFILGTVAFGGLTAKAADVDITNQAGLTNSANYANGNVLNIRQPIELNNAQLPIINNASTVTINGNGNENAITGSLFLYNNDGEYDLTSGHYTIRDAASVLNLNNVNFATMTTASGNAQWGINDSRNWNVYGAIVQNMSGNLNILDSQFSNGGLSVSLERDGSYFSRAYINGGFIDNQAISKITNTNFNDNTVSNTASRTDRYTAFTQGEEARAEIKGGLIKNANDTSTSTMEIKNSSIKDNTITAEAKNDSTRIGVNPGDNNTAHSAIYGGIINNAGTIDIQGVTISGNSANATAESVENSNTVTANVYGGVLYNEGTATIGGNTKISDNSISYNANDGTGSALGGAIYNAGTLNLADVTFSNNTQNGSLNDIYAAANSIMNVTGRAEIGSGLQSADNNAQINIKNGGNLVMVDGNVSTGYTGAVNVETGGILTFKGKTESDALYNSLSNAAKTWAEGSGIGFDFDEDIMNFSQNREGVSASQTISAADIRGLVGNDSALANIDIYKFGNNYITLSDDYSAIGSAVHVTGGTLHFLLDGREGTEEIYFGGGNADTIISDGAKFIVEPWNEAITYSGSLSTDGEENSGTFQKSGSKAVTLTGDNSKFNGNVLVEWNDLIVSKDSYFGANSSVIVDSTLNGGGAGNAQLIYNTSGEDVFKHDVTLKNQGTLSIVGNDRATTSVTLTDGAIKTEGADNTINLSNADFTLNTDLGSDQILNFNNAGITLGEGVTALEHAISLEAGSTINLQNNKVDDITLGDVVAVDNSNNLTIDVNLGGDSDKVAVGNSSKGSLNISDLNITGDGGELQYTIDVITGGPLGLNYTGDNYESKVYEYAISTSGGSLILDAVAMSAGGLKHQNHNVSGDREFHFFGDETYTITEDLQTTLAGGFTVAGKDNTAANSVFSGGDLHSFFEINDSGTNLTLKNLTIEHANATATGDTEGVSTSSDNINGAVVNASTGKVTMNNVVLANNHADGNGGAVYASGDAKVDISNSTLSGNSAQNGGAIYATDNAEVTLTNSTLTGNTATAGSAIYNDGAVVTLNDASISYGAGIYNGGTLNINATNNNTTDAEASLYANEFRGVSIENSVDSTINLNANNSTITIKDITGGNVNINNGQYTGKISLESISDVNATVYNGETAISSTITGSTVNVNSGSNLEIAYQNKRDDVITDSDIIANGIINHLGGNIKNSNLTVNQNGRFNVQGANISGGTITINNGGEFVAQNSIKYDYENTNYTVKEITAKLTGGGTFTKEGQGHIHLIGEGNGADFNGTINVDDGRLRIAAGYGLNADVNIEIDNGGVVDYYISDGTNLSNDTIANFIIGDDGPDAASHLQIVGNGRTNTNANINGKFWKQNPNAQVSFWEGAYTYNVDTSRIDDNMTFHNSDIMFDNLDSGVSNNGDISLSNSSLELLNRTAGEVYNFKNLVSIDESQTYPHFKNEISLDLDLYVDDDTSPVIDTITAENGSGQLNLTRLFITNDNGQILNPAYADKNAIRIINDGNNLTIATADGLELLSWATNVYRYSIDSALNQKGITITDGGPSSTDTLRDLNMYVNQDPDMPNNRGFSFIVNDDNQDNEYHIYRDLNETTSGTFTIVGTEGGNTEKSVLSGKLENLIIEKNSSRLEALAGNKWNYTEPDGTKTPFSASDISSVDAEHYKISVGAMGPDEDRGSFFELVNDTELEILDVTIRDAMRKQGDKQGDTVNGETVEGGSVIYANNENAKVNLQNVDMINNQSYGNGGAINNVKSYVGTTGGNSTDPAVKEQFTISGGIFSGNKSETGLGGAIYTASDMYIKDADFGVNRLNTHHNGEANDIYIADGTVTFNVSDTDTPSIINSGLAGTSAGTLDKTGAGTLSLNGNNANMLGTLKISNGEVYYGADGSEDSFIGGSVNIAGGAKLSMQINSGDNINPQTINNVSGAGELVKLNSGTLNMTGDNSGFNGILSIDEGILAFTKKDTNSYISGITDINSNASLDYTTTDTEVTLANVTGAGDLNKNGTGNLIFNYVTDDGVKFGGTAYSNAGTLTVNAADDASANFDFNMVANGGNIVYNANEGQTYTIDNNSKISFANDVNAGSVTFNGGTYELGSALAGQTGDKEVVFDDGSTIHLTTTEYNTGKFTIKDALIDVADDAFKTYTFDNLNASNGAELSVDLSFDTANGHQADKIISTNGSGTLTLTTLNLMDVFYDDGLTVPPENVEFNILGGGLQLSDLSLDDWATDVYHYTVTTGNNNQSVILTADGAAHKNSLREQNQKEDTRGFQFLKDETYTIGDHLGQTKGGIFTVQGIENKDGSITSHIHGNDQYSMFDVVNKTQLAINDVEISHASKDGNGSVLSHTNADAVTTITNANIHNNNSTGKGGAIYTNNGTLNLEDVTFANNNHGAGANDIYIEGADTVVNYNTTTADKNSISSGIAGDGTLNKTGEEELKLSGNNKDFTGNLVVNQGTLNFTQTSDKDSYISGTTAIANAADVVINTDFSDITTGAFQGSGEITKDGLFDMTLSGNNTAFTGNVNVNEGNIVYNTDNATYFGGSTNLAADTGIVVEGSKDALLSNISGQGTIGKSSAGTLVLSGDNSDFHGNLAVEQGILGIAAGTQLGNMNIGAFGDGTSISMQNTSAVENSDGSWTTNPSPASIENLNFETLELYGDVNLYLDVDLANEKSDMISANNVTVTNDGKLIIGSNSLNLVSDALVKDVKTQVVSGNIAQYVMLDESATTAMGPIQKYMVDYANGYLSFAAQGGSNPSYGDVNPGIMASPVAAQLGGYLVQLNSYDEAFRNMDMYMLMTKEQRQAMKMKNKYAAASADSNIVFDPTVSRYENKSGWFRPYATFENVPLKNGPKVSNVAYGSFFGAESEMYDLGHGWDGIWGVYGGYNGSHQAYDGIGIYQNGGTLGVVGMAYKGNFFTGLTANTGASVGEAQTGFGQDNFTMLMAGIASKSGYNIEFAKGKLIIQPNFTMSYSFVNTFDYHSAAGVSIHSDPLHAIHLEPGIKIIGNLKNGWQPYGSVSMIWNIMDKTEFMANEVNLPELSVKPFVKYGVGVRKSWGERFTGFFQTYLTNGGRNGVGIQLGFRWMLGDKSTPKKTTNTAPKTKKVIKSMK